LDSARFGYRLYTIERMTNYIELFRVANRLDAYSLRKRVREKAITTTPLCFPSPDGKGAQNRSELGSDKPRRDPSPGSLRSPPSPLGEG
ncbi:MAG: hypothetical protein ACRD3O_15800, partial [Terriglobia bacterium]